MYTFDSRIRYSEIAEDGKISVNALIDYMQDCTNFESEDLGVGLDWHKEKGLMWVLSSWQIVIESYPKMGEKITIGTQSCGCEKMLGYRDFLITDTLGGCVAKAHSTWVLMDLEKKRPILITPEIGEVYGKAEPLKIDEAPRKIKVPKEGRREAAFIVREYHLDTNHHVNNRQYVQMAMGFLDRAAKVRELRVEYKKQAMLGDEIVPMVYTVNEQETIVSLNTTEGKPYAIVQFFT